MSVIAYDFYEEDDPNGTLLGTIDDTVAEDLEFRVGYRDAGRGKLVINRHMPEAALIVPGRIVKARVPVIQAAPLFAFRLTDGLFHLISSKEQAGEKLTFAGDGLRGSILRLARLLWHPYAPGQPARGSANTGHDRWWWINEPYGAIATRGIEEGQNQPGAPLADVTIDFTRTLDSDGVAWANIAEEFETLVGTDIEALLDRLAEGGDFILDMEPNLALHAHQTFGVDRTATVHLQKAVSIRSELAREIKEIGAFTHLIQQDKDGNFSEEVSPSYVPGQRAHWGYFHADQTNDDTLLNKIAQDVIRASNASLDRIAVDVDPELYLPGPAGSFWKGDRVKVTTGALPADYNADGHQVTGIRYSLAEATSSANATAQKKSLRIVAELGFEKVRSTSDGLAVGRGGPAAGGAMHLCDLAIACESLPYALMTAATATNGDVEAGASLQWGGGPGTDVRTSPVHEGTNSFGYDEAASGSITYAWDPAQVFEAGVRYVLEYRVAQGGASTGGLSEFGVDGVDETSDAHVIFQGSGTTFTLVRMCWTPSEERTGVSLRVTFTQNLTAGADFYVLDDLKLYTAPHNRGGTDPCAARGDHAHHISEIAGHSDSSVHDHDDDYLTRTDATDDVTTIADAGATHTIENPTANTQDITFTQDCTVTMPAASDGKWFVVRERQDATGGWAVTYTGVSWAGGSAPDPGGANTMRAILFMSDGTGWFGFPAGGSAASALIVREVGGSDIDPVAELEFDATDFIVTDQGGGVARVELTTPAGTHWEPVVHDAGSGPELVFFNGDIVMHEVPN